MRFLHYVLEKPLGMSLTLSPCGDAGRVPEFAPAGGVSGMGEPAPAAAGLPASGSACRRARGTRLLGRAGALEVGVGSGAEAPPDGARRQLPVPRPAPAFLLSFGPDSSLVN